jgi:hypothetical protein
MKSDRPTLPVAVIGAGPVGLAAAAHLLARGFEPLVLEAADHLSSAFQATRHVRLFSPWRYNMDREAVRMLEASGWKQPEPDTLPTAGDMVDLYLAPLAAIPQMRNGLRTGRRVVAITREGFDKVKTPGREHAAFLVRTEGGHGPEEHRAFAVIDASGTWGTPNPLGANGLPAHGEPELRDQIAYGMPDVLGAARSRYAGKRVLVVGAGHSATGSLIALARLAEEVPGTEVAWAIRGDNLARIFGGGENDGLPARGELGRQLKRLRDAQKLSVHTNFRTTALREGARGIVVEGLRGDGATARIEGFDEIICATGSRPDLSLATELRLKLDPWLESTEALAPLIDPNLHSCGTVRPHGHRELGHPEAGFYMIGAKSYGRAPNFLLATGYEQARSVVAALAGDMASADDVQLELPETGVCSTGFAPEKAAAACCGGPAPEPEKACCVKDAKAKAAGKSGCGCGPAQETPAPVATAGCCPG